MAASSQPLAVEAAIDVLRNGGNAIDAAVTATAVLSVVEPMSTGLGGDLFAIIWLAKEQRLIGLNASGRASRLASAESLLAGGHERVPMEGPLSVTVPGALDGMAQCLAAYGTIELDRALAPAIIYAEDGFPVTEVAAQMWARAQPKLSRYSESARVWLPQGRAPHPGEVFRNPDLSHSLKLIAEQGPDAFYRGEIGDAIAKALNDLGGAMHPDDLSAHTSNWVEPIKTSYRGFDVAELPPNNQGLAALMALNIAEGFALNKMPFQSAEYLHCLIEAMKLAFADAHAYVADPREPIDLDVLLSKQYARQRREEVKPDKAAVARPGALPPPGDTVYIAVVDEQRNVVSMISSVFKLFGSGITVPGTGLVLQNRGSCFTLEPGHPNRLAPGKRPFHTIIPAMILRDNRPWACFGLVGGPMQPQGHLQLVSNLVDFEMNPQAALDAPRFRILDNGDITLESGISDKVHIDLATRGHRLKSEQTEEGYGGGQVILISDEALFGGSDPRKDGCAIGY